MAWFDYRLFGSHNGESWSDVTDVAPHPRTPIAAALAWVDAEMRASKLSSYLAVRLERREGTYRPVAHWKVLGEWRHGQRVHGEETVANAAARFWRKVSKTDTCWLWTGAKTTWGY